MGEVIEDDVENLMVEVFNFAKVEPLSWDVKDEELCEILARCF